MARSHYRAEIDGLRALAVVPVILFHAGFEWFKGGFIGVDVFFVISGYLITTIIITELAEEKFSLAKFYERRARRILPALFFVMAVSLPFAWFWLIPTELKDFGHSLIAVSTFSSNILFWLESGYFDTAGELKPLLHTWSLAVEEQYYLLFPIFLIIVWRVGTRWLLVLLSLLFFMSLGAAQWGAYNSPSATFYLLPARGWELLIGVFAAFYLKYKHFIKSRSINQVLSVIGLGLITYSVCTFDKGTPFPSLYALIPTVGTGLLILSAVPGTLVHRFLCLRPLVTIGLISYSSYLWHQPILAFARQRSVLDLSSPYLVALCFATFLIAYISWRWVEKPFRDPKKVSAKLCLQFSLFGIISFSVIGFVLGTNTIGSKSPTILSSIQYTSLSDKMENEGYVCNVDTLSINTNFTYCNFGSGNSERQILVYGDSHVGALQYELDKVFKEKNIKGIWLREVLSEGYLCETTIFNTIKGGEENELLLNCRNSFSEAISEFSNVESIILLNRWTAKYFPVPGLIKSHNFTNKKLECEERDFSYREYIAYDESKFYTDNLVGKSKAINSLLSMLPSNVSIALVYPVPEIGCDIYKYNLNNYRRNGLLKENLSFPVLEYDERNKFVIDAFDKYLESSSASNIIPVRLRHVFCDKFHANECSIIYDSIPLYFDDDHLSDFGAELVVSEIFKSFQNSN